MFLFFFYNVFLRTASIGCNIFLCFFNLQNLPIPESFPEAFVIRVMETYNLTLQEIHRLSVFGQICLPNGECIDPCDAGNICCT